MHYFRCFHGVWALPCLFCDVCFRGDFGLFCCRLCGFNERPPQRRKFKLIVKWRARRPCRALFSIIGTFVRTRRCAPVIGYQLWVIGKKTCPALSLRRRVRQKAALRAGYRLSVMGYRGKDLPRSFSSYASSLEGGGDFYRIEATFSPPQPDRSENGPCPAVATRMGRDAPPGRP